MNLKELKNSNTLVTVFVDNLNNTTILEETFYSISKQLHKIDLLVLYPESFEKEQIDLLKGSLDNAKIIIRKKNEEANALEEHVIEADEPITYFLSKTNSTSFSQIFNEGFNVALENEYEFYSIVEPFDIVGLNWYAQANLYAQENEKVSMFFPIIRNTVNGVFNGLLNEATWAEGLSEEAGKADLNLLQRFNCIIPLGGLIRTNSIAEFCEKKGEKLCPIKESIKISHYYEFLMRMVYNDIKIMTVPRVGYEFKVNNTTNFNHTSCKVPHNITQIPIENGGVSQSEGKFWMDLAKKEYFFDEDRNKVYEESK